MAGTGKIFIAMEKARRRAAAGKRVLLTCYNKNLVGLLREHVKHEKVAVDHFHGFLTDELMKQGVLSSEQIREDSAFFSEELPNAGFDYYSSMPNDQKFDSIIIDEGQDFQEL